MGISELVAKIKKLFYKPAKHSPFVVTAKAWSLSVQGELIEIRKLDIDKSGKNPNYLLYGAIRLESYNLEGAEFEVPEIIYFKGKEKDFNEKTELSFVEGEKVNLEFTGTEVPTGRFTFK